MSYNVEVILPLPLDQKFTYFVSKQEFDFIKPGMRIIVPFGKSKFITCFTCKMSKPLAAISVHII